MIAFIHVEVDAIALRMVAKPIGEAIAQILHQAWRLEIAATKTKSAAGALVRTD